MATIDKSLAVGIRKSYARTTTEALKQHIKNIQNPNTGAIDFEELLRRDNVLCGTRPRRPSLGMGGGRDLVFIDHADKTGELFFAFQMANKRGEVQDGRLAQLLMSVSLHAVESLYQRLKTLDWKRLGTELHPVGKWFFENMHVIEMEEEGYLVTPTGVFPVIRGPYKKSRTFSPGPHWLATTWIAQENLEDHTPHKRRVAEAVREVSGKGVQFVRLRDQ